MVRVRCLRPDRLLAGIVGPEVRALIRHDLELGQARRLGSSTTSSPSRARSRVTGSTPCAGPSLARLRRPTSRRTSARTTSGTADDDLAVRRSQRLECPEGDGALRPQDDDGPLHVSPVGSGEPRGARGGGKPGISGVEKAGSRESYELDSEREHTLRSVIEENRMS